MALKIILGVLLYLSIGFGIAVAAIRFFYPEEDNDIFDDIAPVVMMFLWPLGVPAIALTVIFFALEKLFRRIRESAKKERVEKLAKKQKGE